MARTRFELVTAITRLGEDERAVLEWVLDGLEQGRQVYGELRTRTDQRNFRLEAMQEIRDALVYCGAAIVRETERP